jgi:hypothetical protein
MLRERGTITLSQTLLPTPKCGAQSAVRDPGHLMVVVDREVRVRFDLSDHSDVCGAALDDCDLYFKRSLLKGADASESSKLRPLGINYGIFPDKFDFLDFPRLLKYEKPLNFVPEILRLADVKNRFFYLPRPRFMEAPPIFDAPRRVVFISRAWDPGIFTDQTGSKIEEVVMLNEFRANCIRGLRDGLGDGFVGGFTSTPYGERCFGDIIIKESRAASRRSYSERVQSCSIGVSTVGLHGSTPWKLGEYVSLSMPVVSEPLLHQYPGDFISGQNYLEFSSVDQCVDRCAFLLSNKTAFCEMAMANLHYYHSYLRPDMLVLNALLQAVIR